MSRMTSPAPPVLPVERKITLQIGERTFYTTRDTLTEKSGFFSSLLSGRWDNVQSDGSYFIDADPKLFEHILQYLRRGVFPVFFDYTNGHDHALYLALREEARYFQIPRLEKWLRKKIYLQAVRVQYTTTQSVGGSNNTTSDTELKHHLEWMSRNVYVCPRGIEVHRGEPSACGRQCKNALALIGPGAATEKEAYLKNAVVEKKIIFVNELCLDTPDLEV